MRRVFDRKIYDIFHSKAHVCTILKAKIEVRQYEAGQAKPSRIKSNDILGHFRLQQFQSLSKWSLI